jgi:predicted AAA+ superfamily ATPase
MDESSRQYPRHIAGAIRQAMADTPVVCLAGPRQAGKTTLVRTLFPERAYVTLDDAGLNATARHDPVGFVAGLPSPVTLDEVQRAPELLPAIKMAVDRDRRPGRFLLTGSANLLLPKTSESLAGRMEIVRIHPLSEAEKERAAGTFLARLLAGKLVPRVGATAEAGPGLARRLLAGGYPEPLSRSPARARQWHRQYLQAILERDLVDLARVRHVEDVSRLLALLAIRTGTLLNASSAAGELGMHRETIEHHLAVLERLFLVRRLPAWQRSAAKRLIKTPKVHLVDSGLAGALADLSEEDWTVRRERFGCLLESFVVQQLICMAGWTDPALRFWHYRDKDQVEVDLVITRGSRVWGVEVKASATIQPGDGRGLRCLAEQAGDSFQAGILLYAGSHNLRLGDERFLAASLSELWS